MATYELNGCTYETRRETVKDALKADALARTFPPDTSWEFARTFARYAILTTVDGRPVLGKPLEKLRVEELHAAADAWGDNDPEAVYLFYEALAADRQAGRTNPVHLQPQADEGN